MNPALDPKVQAAVRPDSTWSSLLEVGAQEVFQIMLQINLAKLPNADKLSISGDVTSMVGLAGALCGVLSIRCNSRTAQKIAERMLGSMWTVNPEEVPDAMAEICNMVAGNFKSKVAQLAENCMLSVPTVIRGEDYEMFTIPMGEHITLGLAYDGVPIWFCLAVHT